MRRTKSVILLAAVAGLLAASVGTVAAAGGGTGGTLEGTTWLLARYQSSSGAMADVPAGVETTAVFKAGTVSGNGGCNTYAGPYTQSGASLTFGQLATTMMACPDPQMSVESAYYAALAKSATYTALTDALTIYDASGNVLLVFDAQAATPLAGPATWYVTSYNNGKGAVTSVIDGTAPTAVFGTDGTVSGNATCNRYFGPYTTTGNAIKIGPLGSTMMACPDTAQQDQETAYLAALQASTTYSINGLTLELRDAQGALQVSFAGRAIEPVPTDEPVPSAVPYDTGDTGTTDGSATPPPTSTTAPAQQGGLPAGLMLLAVGALALVAVVGLRRRSASL
jgi:heat shock protein HslJ